LKIIDIIGYSLSSPYGDGNVYGQPLGVKSVGIVEVHTDNEYIGIGETYSGVYVPELINPIVEYLKSFIIGADPDNISEINHLLEIPFISGNGLVRSIISAIDIALWDIKGQSLNKPIAKILNSQIRESVSVYASGGSVTMNSDEICNDIERTLTKGYNAYKMRVGLQSWKKDIERVSTARNTIGENNQLMIDAIMGTLPNTWGLDRAKKCIKDLSVFNLTWLEEPLPPENFSGYQKLNKDSPIPIAMGESLTATNEFEAYISGNCVGYIQPDVTHCGGFSRTIKVINIAKKYNIPVALHVWGSAISIMSNLHIALAMPEVIWLEIPQVRLNLLFDQLSENINIENGSIFLIDKPGLGISINKEEKNRYPFIPGSGYKVPLK